jgi:hypothetical protein
MFTMSIERNVQFWMVMNKNIEYKKHKALKASQEQTL